MGKRDAPRQYVLDTGALIAQEHRDARVTALFVVAAARRIEMVLPSVVLAQVWRDSTRQVQLTRALRNPGIIEAPLDHEDARQVGELLRDSATSDMADAHVVVLAGRLRAVVITSAAGDIANLDATLPVIEV